MKWPVLLALLPGCGACQDITPTVDAIPDPCSPEMQFTGEYVDWDSSLSAFMGIFGATFTLEGDPLKSTMTAPNGRFLMCIPADNGLVSVVPMAGQTYVPGRIVVSKMVVQSDAIQSYRSFTAARAADFGFDPALAQVYVHVSGGQRMVMLDSAAGVKKIFDGTAWIDGSVGSDFYFGNVPGTTTTTNVSGGSSFGGGTIPLAPGTFTYLTIVAN